jgi:divalent metal cation (Fe/Co/Zn/Cd) transporter
VLGRKAAAHNSKMAGEEKSTAPEVLQRVLRIQTLTLIWMSVEAGVSLGAAWTARSPALLAFGGDSAVELLSAVVVFWRFSVSTKPHANREIGVPTEERASRIAGGLLFVLAAFVVTTSVLALSEHMEARPSYIGVGLLVLAAMIMPWLAAQKRQLSIRTGSAALKADAAESAVCGYLALIALAGLAVNAVWKVSWADPVAALALLPLILREGWEAWKGKPCCH